MKLVIRATVASLLAIFMGAALADGVPLISAGPALSSNDSARQLQAMKMPNFVRLHPIVLNKSAFGANVLTVVIEGKEYGFVGALMPKWPQPPKGVTEKQPQIVSWSGKGSGRETLVISKDEETGELMGYVFLPPARNFRIVSPRGGSVVLLETDANVVATLNYIADGVAASAPKGRP